MRAVHGEATHGASASPAPARETAAAGAAAGPPQRLPWSEAGAVLVALGVTVAFRTGILDIGAEGQMPMGILASTAVALALPRLPHLLVVTLSLLAGAAAGGVWAGLAGWLRARRDVNEILSTVMLNDVAAQRATSSAR